MNFCCILFILIILWNDCGLSIFAFLKKNCNYWYDGGLRAINKNRNVLHASRFLSTDGLIWHSAARRTLLRWLPIGYSIEINFPTNDACFHWKQVDEANTNVDGIMGWDGMGWAKGNLILPIAWTTYLWKQVVWDYFLDIFFSQAFTSIMVFFNILNSNTNNWDFWSTVALELSFFLLWIYL